MKRELEKILIMALIVLLFISVVLAFELRVWRIAFNNLCETYCNSLGYSNYVVKDYACSCRKSSILRI